MPFLRIDDTQYYADLLNKVVTEWWPLKHFNSTWDKVWVAFVYRLRKYVPGLNFTPHLPYLYAKISNLLTTRPDFMGMFGRGGSLSVVSTLTQFTDIRKTGKLAGMLLGVGSADDVYGLSEDEKKRYEGLLHGSRKQNEIDVKDINEELQQRLSQDEQHSAGFIYLRRLLASITTSFHPSNQGMFSVGSFTVNPFLQSLCMKFVQRVGAKDGVSKVDGKALIKMILPLVKMVLAGKSDQDIAIAQSCICQLAYVSPRTVYAEMSEFIVEGLSPQNTNKVHLGPASMKALDVLAQPFVHSAMLLPELLPQVLHLTLPGIDANDNSKTIVTLRLYSTILQWVPLANTNALDVGKYPPANEATGVNKTLDPAQYGMDEAVGVSDSDLRTAGRDAMWRAGPVLATWGLEVIQRLLEMFASQKPASKEASNSDKAITGLVDRVLSRLFQRMDPSTQQAAERKVIGWLQSNVFPNAKDMVGSMVTAMFLASADRPGLMKQLFAPMAKRVVKHEKHSSREVSWALLVLSSISKAAGPLLVDGANDIMAVISAACKGSEDEKVNEGGQALLGAVLEGLLGRYETSPRSISSELIEKGWEVVAVRWGALSDVESVTPIFHSPSTQEIALASSLREEYAIQTLKSVLALVEEKKEKKKIKAGLDLVCAATLGQDTGTAEISPSLLSHLVDGLKSAVLNMPHAGDVYEGFAQTLAALLLSKPLPKSDKSAPGQSMLSRFFDYLDAAMASQAHLSSVEGMTHNGGTQLRPDEAFLLSLPSGIAVCAKASTMLSKHQRLLTDDAVQAALGAGLEEVMRLLIAEGCINTWGPTRKVALRAAQAVLAKYQELKQVTASAALEAIEKLEGIDAEERYAKVDGSCQLLREGAVARAVTASPQLLRMFVDRVVGRMDANAQGLAQTLAAYNLEQGACLSVLKQWQRVRGEDAMAVAEAVSGMAQSSSWRTTLTVSGFVHALVDRGQVGEGTWKFFLGLLKSKNLLVKVSSIFGVFKLLVSDSADGVSAHRGDVVGSSVDLINGLCEMKTASMSKTDAAWNEGAKFVLSLADFARDQGVAAGWSPLADAYESAFWPSNALLFAFMTKRLGMPFVDKALPHVKQLMTENTGTSEFEGNLVCASEVVAGILRGTAGSSDAKALAKRLESEVIPLMITTANGLSLAFATTFVDTARFATDETSPQEPLLAMAMDNLVAQLKVASSSFTSISNALRMVRVLYNRNPRDTRKAFSTDLCAALKRSASSPFTVVRKETASTAADFVRTLLEDNHEKSDALVGEILDSLRRADEKKTLETAVGVIRALSAQGKMNTHVLSLLAPLFTAVAFNGDAELNKAAKEVCNEVSDRMDTDGVAAIAEITKVGLASTLWRCREQATQMLGGIAYKHGFVMTVAAADIYCRKVTERILYDTQLEVQQQASKQLLLQVSTLHSASPSVARSIRKFEKMALADDADEQRQRRKRIVGVLGLSAIILAYPYSVPFPQAVITLARVANRQAASYGDIAQKTIDGFKRTHRDTWEKDKEHFGEELQMSRATSGYA